MLFSEKYTTQTRIDAAKGTPTEFIEASKSLISNDAFAIGDSNQDIVNIIRSLI